MKVISFKLKGNIGHFRRPDTTGTHLSFPIITRTVVHGLIASVLGMEKLDGEAWIGVNILSPVKTKTQELSMLGKGWFTGGKLSFNRPTAIELVVSPNYLIYYAGDYLDKLKEMLINNKSHYHTYLGSAYCLTFPIFVEIRDYRELEPPFPEKLISTTVVPSHSIDTLLLIDDAKYGKVGGMHYEHLGDRVFKDTINVIYDFDGKRIFFKPKESCPERTHPYKFISQSEEEVICLW